MNDEEKIGPFVYRHSDKLKVEFYIELVETVDTIQHPRRIRDIAHAKNLVYAAIGALWGEERPTLSFEGFGKRWRICDIKKIDSFS